MTESFARAEVEIEVPFHDIDVMGIAWHGHYAKYLELARCALLDTFDYDVESMQESGYVWPVIEMKIRYAQPLSYRQKIRVEAKLVEIENRMKIDYRIFDVETGRRLTRAHTVQVALDADSGEMLFASPRALLERFQ
ncbi:acyl-CoA thioesterase [Pseudohalioglobus lutimaris]|uniref:Acyl-CoA thioesterase n=1 Tax=Pseudohalioglobus lutimaris TaxID=1737061 RepID=A0A2N5WZJ6_9GAMM|nr:acyl-CoA thioesterase [Pseudohalioglobus lutimaris]PLW67659.1 acyl-CoA thioesterase [Pseudohalioglobus lutimaris]